MSHRRPLDRRPPWKRAVAQNARAACRPGCTPPCRARRIHPVSRSPRKPWARPVRWRPDRRPGKGSVVADSFNTLPICDPLASSLISTTGWVKNRMGFSCGGAEGGKRNRGGRRSSRPWMLEFEDNLVESVMVVRAPGGFSHIFLKKCLGTRCGTLEFVMKPAFLLLLMGTAARAAVLEGRVFDPSSAVVPGVEVRLLREGQAALSAKSGPDGSFRFDGLPAGGYQVQVLAPGFVRFERGVRVSDEAPVFLAAPLRLGEIEETITVTGAGTARPQARTPERIRVGGNVTPARMLAAPKPVYPAEAQSSGREGVVVVRAVVGVEGKVLGATALPGSDAVLAPAALDAVKGWTYSPAELNGKPVEFVVTANVRFVLR
ncbi:MAG: TonB family protein [Acidobacteria bacterium]|nr:TonB family protein [Acidobacteriota bacterium]